MAGEPQEDAAPAGDSARRDAAPTLPPYPGVGFRIDEFLILDTLGHGSMATVFLASDATGHEVALKIFQEGPGVSATMLERFRREAEASKKLRRHPNIITIYATGKDGPYHYISMETVAGSRTLEDVLAEGTLSMNNLVRVIVKIARALQYAHERRIVHRDVKPTNIMIDEFGEPLLTDFGVASLKDWPSCTLTGALTGTPLYMSPEQASADETGPQSDIYSLGVVLFEALTGVLPHSETRNSPVGEVLEAVKNEAPRRPRSFRRDISPDLEAVMLKALEKNPRDRYPDAEGFAIDLERALAGRPVSAFHFHHFDRLRYFVRRHRHAMQLVLVAVLVAGGSIRFFRERLSSAQHENLVQMARLQNAFFERRSGSVSASSGERTPRAWHELRLARQEMQSGEWQAASQRLQASVNLAAEFNDQRTMAVARLEQARCETMIGNRPLAMDLYKWVVQNHDASAADAEQAQCEYLALALLARDRDNALKVLLWRNPPLDGPLRLYIDCLGGEIPADLVAERIASIPRPFRNDVAFAAAIQYYLESDPRKSARMLRRVMQESAPSQEWPAPFARMLYAEINR